MTFDTDLFGAMQAAHKEVNSQPEPTLEEAIATIETFNPDNKEQNDEEQI